MEDIETYRFPHNLVEATKGHFGHLISKHGFRHVQYPASSRYSKTSPKLDEEITIRAMEHSEFLVEHSRILKTPLGRKVKSKSVRGDIVTCVAYVNEIHPN